MIYVITDGDNMKIGKSNNPKSRLSQLQTGNSRVLKIEKQFPGGLEEEKQLHQELSAYRKKNEWFLMSERTMEIVSSFEKKMTTHDVTPDVKKIYQLVIPSSGHDFQGAIADLIDNSYDAKATSVSVNIFDDEERGSGYIGKIVLADNGMGMNHKTLKESFRYATNTSHKVSDLGKYGVGGTIACFSLGSHKKTLTKEKNGSLIVAEMSIESIMTSDYPLSIRVPTDEEEEFFNKTIQSRHADSNLDLFKDDIVFDDKPAESGTVVIISDIKQDIDIKRSHYAIQRLSSKFSSTFYNLITDDFKIKLIRVSEGNVVSDIQVIGLDPLHADRPELVTYSDIEEVDFKGSKILIRSAYLESHREDKSFSRGGVYLNRNGRLIQEGGNLSGVYKATSISNALRIELKFDASLDEEFRVATTKNRSNPSNELREFLREKISKLSSRAQQTYKNRNRGKVKPHIKKEDNAFHSKMKQNPVMLGIKEISDFNTVYVSEKHQPLPTWLEIDENGACNLYINQLHPFIAKFYESVSEETRSMLRMIWYSELLIENEYIENTSEKGVVEDFRERVGFRLAKFSKIQKNLD